MDHQHNGKTADKITQQQHTLTPTYSDESQAYQALYAPTPLETAAPNAQPWVTPHNVMRLQRTVGNQGVLRLLRGQHTARRVQREGPGDPTPVGNVYELKFDKKGDRWSLGFIINFSGKKTSPAKTEGGGVSAQIGESKLSKTYSNGASKAANAMSLALAKASFDIVELAPGLKVKFDTKALEAKVENGDVDVDIFKVAVTLEGDLTKASAALFSSDLVQAINEGYSIKISAKGEIKIDPSDAVRLARMAKANKEIAENAKAAADAVKQQKKLLEQNKRLEKFLQEANRNKRKRKQLAAEIKKAKEVLAANKGKLKQLGAKLTENAKATKALTEVVKTASSGLKSKSGKLVGLMVKKVGGKLLAKAIPVLGWILTAVDVGTLLYDVYNGAKLEFGLGGGEGGEAGPEGAEGTDGGSTEGVPGGTADSGTTDSGAGGSKDGGAGGEGGQREGGTGGEKNGSEVPDMSEINIDENMNYTPAGGTSAGQTTKPPLHPAAEAVAAAMKDANGVVFTTQDYEQLNQIVPQNLTEAQKTALVEWVKANKAGQATDAVEVLGALHQQVTKMQEPAPNTTMTITNPDGTVETTADPTPTDPQAATSETSTSTPAGETSTTGTPTTQTPKATTPKPKTGGSSGASGGKEQKPLDPKVIRQAVQDGKANLLEHNSSLFLSVPKGIKQGETANTWIYTKIGDQFFAGYTTVTITQRTAGSLAVKVTFAPTGLYGENGLLSTHTFSGGTHDMQFVDQAAAGGQ
jgi:hypothetical protein